MSGVIRNELGYCNIRLLFFKELFSKLQIMEDYYKASGKCIWLWQKRERNISEELQLHQL
jgi:hypothetical protein